MNDCGVHLSLRKCKILSMNDGTLHMQDFLPLKYLNYSAFKRYFSFTDNDQLTILVGISLKICYVFEMETGDNCESIHF